MRAMVLEKIGEPLVERELPTPEATGRQLLIRVHSCAVCRTDLHVFDGDLPDPKLPLVLGHEIVGTVIAVGRDAPKDWIGKRVGVPWLGGTCGECSFCRSHRENLCDEPLFTGYTVDGGFAELALADERYCFELPAGVADEHAAPLLCAGLIGYRSYRMTGAEPGESQRLGFYGFGAAAHILIQIARHDGHEVFAFVRPGDDEAIAFARELGAAWVGGSDRAAPAALDAAIIFASIGELVPTALRAVRKGGVVVCAGIHMSDIPSFPYADLWGERVIRSVTNLTREDGERFFALVVPADVRTEIEVFPLREANVALERLRSGKLRGAAVLRVKPD
ncbi:MAG: zinc-dependent alcohol dehydrogenase family protein [Planctomycetes bacterium]|nr:zinc-dependent alcohol dehydrogenase family protein [Planctomycetota bacterium]